MEQKTPPYDVHVEEGGKIVPFAGYLLPVQYGNGIIAEHEAVRTKVGLFDVSHMGEVLFTGPGALATINHLFTNDYTDMPVGKVRYGVMCNEHGGCIDDLIVYKFGEEEYFVVVNASNREKDVAHMEANLLPDTSFADLSDCIAELALQGPRSREVLEKLCNCHCHTNQLPTRYREIAQRVTMHLKKRGVAVEASAQVTGIQGELGALTVSYVDRRGNDKAVEAEGVLVACGRRANTEGLFSTGVAPELVRGALVCDAAGRTSVERLWAIGDVVADNIQLAHVAEAQARNVVAAICGDELPVDMAIVPSCVYTSPEVASVGLTESEAKSQGIAVRTAKALTGANGKCLVEGSESGYVKLVADASTGAILGAQLVCPHATDLVSELALAISLGCTAARLAGVIHPHPTVSELVSSAARALNT